MDRRKSLKVIALGSLSAGVLLDACNTGDKKNTVNTTPAKDQEIAHRPGRMQEEIKHEAALEAETYFNPHEMAAITILADIIIPRDEVSGSASDAGVPAFIEFIVKEKPEYKIPVRGGLQWLDQQCLKRFNNPFEKCRPEQQTELLDLIAYPQKAAENMGQGVAFFSLMRNLTASGFYTSQIGVKDLGYKGNQPNMWNGVPDDVLKQYHLAYTEQEMKECATYPE